MLRTLDAAAVRGWCEAAPAVLADGVVDAGERRGERAVRAVVAGSGLVRLFRDAGAHVVDAGPSAPSAVGLTAREPTTSAGSCRAWDAVGRLGGRVVQGDRPHHPLLLGAE